MGSDHQIKRGIENFSTKTYVVTPHWNHLGETALMMGHKICFDGKIWKIIPVTPIGSTDEISLELPHLLRTKFIPSGLVHMKYMANLQISFRPNPNKWLLP